MYEHAKAKKPGGENPAHEATGSRLASRPFLMALNDLPEAQKYRNAQGLFVAPPDKGSCYGPSELRHIRIILDFHSAPLGFTFDFVTSTGDFWINTADRVACDDCGDHISLCPALCEAITKSLLGFIEPRCPKEPQHGDGDKAVSASGRG